MKELKDLKVALVHDYLSEFGGAEGVLQAIWELFPQADIYTAAYDAEKMAKVGAFQGAKVLYPHWRPNWSGQIGRFVHLLLVANLPLYFESLDLRGYDLVISSTAHFAKGVLTRPDQLHISYIHTPTRSIYGYKGESSKRNHPLWRLILAPLDSVLRIIDYSFAQRPDYLLCNSREVQARIKKFYGRTATIVSPFPNTSCHSRASGNPDRVTGSRVETPGMARRDGEAFYLVVSRLATYKNIDLIIHTCGKNKLPLKVAGTGSSHDYLRQIAAKYPSVEMLGTVSEEEKVTLYQKCKAVIGAVQDEDFGMAPLEPMFFGKPVVVLRQGGYLETVTEGENGVFFDELTESSLLAGIKKLDATTWSPEKIKELASRFSKNRFQQEFKKFVVERFIAQ